MRLLAKAYHKLLSKLFWVITVALLLQACGISNHTPPLPPNETDTTFYVANILQSNMVVQRNKPFTLWGRANAGDKISVTVSWNTGPVTAITSADNKWEAVIPASAANNNAQIITIKTDNRPAIIFNNILIGDVWLCSGQSNMAMPVAPDGKLFEGVTDYANEVATANYPLIRVCTIETDRQAQPLATFKSKPEWTVCSPTTVGKLSATGYYFARKLQTELNVPVGIIVSAVNDEGCSLWVNHEVFSADSTFAAIFGGGRASQLYNGMINPLIKLQLTGILWYQGENNLTDIPDRYAMLNTALINGWRKQFNQGMLPFYLVQLTPFANNANANYPNADDYALFREAQAKIVNSVPGTGIVITNDIGEVLNHHPRNKKPVGERLALFALKNEYGKAVSPFAPTYKSHIQNGKTITITFNNADGLKTINGRPLNQLFFVADGSMQFVKANAAINGNKIVLTIPYGMEKSALFIRYAFTNTAITNLQNDTGLPVASFRTDK